MIKIAVLSILVLFTLLIVASHLILKHINVIKLNRQLNEDNLYLRNSISEQSELASKLVQLELLFQVVKEIKYDLIKMRKNLTEEEANNVDTILRKLKNGIPEDLWDDFPSRFWNINDEFNQALFKLAPDLMPVELKIANFLRLNMSSKEISKLTNRTPGTVANARTSLRRKLKLDKEESLIIFLMNL